QTDSYFVELLSPNTNFEVWQSRALHQNWGPRTRTSSAGLGAAAAPTRPTHRCCSKHTCTPGCTTTSAAKQCITGGAPICYSRLVFFEIIISSHNFNRLSNKEILSCEKFKFLISNEPKMPAILALKTRNTFIE